MTQADFAASLDMLQNSYSAIEKGTWLRTGIGEMFVDSPKGPVSEDEKKLIDLFRRLVPEMRDIVLKKVREMVKSPEESWVPPKDNEDKKKEKRTPNIFSGDQRNLIERLFNFHALRKAPFFGII